MREIVLHMHTGLHVKYPLFLSDFNGTWIFSTDFRKMFKYQISWKSFQWSRFIPCRRTDGQTHDAATSRFSQFLRKRLKTYKHSVGRAENFYLVICKVTEVTVNLFYIVHSVHNWEQFHDTKTTKCTHLFPRYLHYSITLNILICFGSQGNFITELTKARQHKGPRWNSG